MISLRTCLSFLLFLFLPVRFAAATPTNLGPQARATASSISAVGTGDYLPELANDGTANPDNWSHWCNDGGGDPASDTNAVRLTLTWSAARSIRSIVVHTKRSLEVQDFKVEYLDGAEWRLFPEGEVRGNLEHRVAFLAPAAVSTTSVRLSATRGPERQPELVRVSELEVFGDDPSFDLPVPGIAIRHFEPEKPLCRALRPAVLVAEIFNSRTNAQSVTPYLAAPPGVRVLHSANALPVTLEDQEKKRIKWIVEFEQEGVYSLPLTLSEEEGGIALSNLTVRVLPPVTPGVSSSVPPPQPVETTTLVGALNWPYWSRGVHDFWKPLEKNPERTPALGFYGQETAQVNEWELKWAAEHGIGFFVYNWGRSGRGLGAGEWTFPFGNNHIAQRLTNPVFTAHVKCALQFNNGQGADGVGGANDLLLNLAPYWIDTFFKRPDYLKLDNKPVLFIYDGNRLVEDLGGAPQTAVALESVRALCRDAGFAGLYVVGESRFYDVPAADGPESQRVQQFAAAGMDATYAYHWFLGDNPDSPTAIQRQLTYYQKAREFGLGTIPPIMTASMGWTGWRDEASVWRIPPGGYQSLLEQVKAVNETLPTNSLGRRIVLLDSWNEFGEGHYIAPHREHGFDYLDAVRNAFATNLPAGHVDLIPEDVGLGPYDDSYRNFLGRDAALQPVAERKISAPPMSDAGLVARWSFDEETTFPVAYDYSGNRLGGILRNSARADSPSGKALNPLTGCVSVAADEKLSPSAGLTISCWVRTENGAQDGTYILNRLYLGNDSGYQLSMQEGRPSFCVPEMVGAIPRLTADTDLPTGRWVHLAGTCDGKTMRIYVDGRQAGSMTRYGRINANNSTLWIGNYAESPFLSAAAFQGLIDEVRIYNRALTASELASQVSGGLAANPVAAGQSLSMTENTAKTITLAGTHPENSTILTQPRHGTLTGTGAKRTYTPDADYSGPDDFTFNLSKDGVFSGPATVSIMVNAGTRDGLVGWWKMDETSGTVVGDSSGRGNHGSVSGGFWTSGRTGGALKLDGTNGYATIPDSDDLDGLSAMTIAAWIRIDRMPSQLVAPLAKETGDQSYRIIVGSSGAAQFVAATANNGWYSHGGWVDAPANTFTEGRWQHVVGTYDGAQLRFYVDGQLVGAASASLSGAIYDGVSPLTMGLAGDYGGNYLDGALDDVRIYNRALSATEVDQLFASADAPNPFNSWAGEGVSVTPDLLRRYAIGGASGPAFQGQSVSCLVAEGSVSLSAIVRTNDSRLDVFAEHTTDLAGPWERLPTNPAGIRSIDQIGVPSDCERLNFAIEPSAAPKCFLRLRVRYLPD